MQNKNTLNTPNCGCAKKSSILLLTDRFTSFPLTAFATQPNITVPNRDRGAGGLHAQSCLFSSPHPSPVEPHHSHLLQPQQAAPFATALTSRDAKNDPHLLKKQTEQMHPHHTAAQRCLSAACSPQPQCQMTSSPLTVVRSQQGWLVGQLCTDLQ